MAVETATYIGQLNAAFPAGGEPIAQGDDHLRLIKSALQNTFPGLNSVWTTPGDARWVGKTGDQTMAGKLTAAGFLSSIAQGAEINALTRKDYVDGLVGGKVSKSGDTMTGILVAPTVRIQQPTYPMLEFHATGNYASAFFLNQTNGALHYGITNGSGLATDSLLTIDRSGNITMPGALTAGTNVSAINGIVRGNYVDADSTITIGDSGGFQVRMYDMNQGGTVSAVLFRLGMQYVPTGQFPAFIDFKRGTGATDGSIYFAAGQAVMAIVDPNNGLISNVSQSSHTLAFTVKQYVDSLLGSDAQYKSDVQSLDNALATVKQLRGVSFTWNEDFPDASRVGKRSCGVIAQEVEEVLPEAVYDSTMKAVEGNALAGLLLEAVKELSAKLEAAVAEIAALKAAK